LLELDRDTLTLARHVLAPVGGDGHAPVRVIASGHWQAARSVGGYAFVGCTVGPGFDFADFRLLSDDATAAAELRQTWPEFASLI
jgi:predicted cupin superfamily sugar epimerase